MKRQIEKLGQNLKRYKHCTYALLLSVGILMTFSSMKPVPHSTPNRYEDRIRAQFRSGHWNYGAAILDSALTEYPNVAAFYELKGQHILHELETQKKKVKPAETQKSYELARYYLIKSIEMDEKNLNSRRLLLRIDTETKQYSSAIVYCNELLEQTPYNEHLWRTKIDLYRKLGNNVEADRLLERLQTIYHDDPQLKKDVAYRKTLLVKEQRDKGDYQGMEESLRQLINLEPQNAENYYALFNLLYRSGRMNEAAELADRAAQSLPSYADRDDFIAKRVSVLMEMDRYSEAQAYLNAKKSSSGNPILQRLKTELDIETARRARLNDPYEAYAKVYDKGHNEEALNYLIGTSIQRGYHDDALYYIREARQRHDSPKLQYQEYMVMKRMGYDNKANDMLRALYESNPADTAVALELAAIYLQESAVLLTQEQYDEAIPVLQYVYTMNADPEYTYVATRRLLNCYIQTHQFAQAEMLMDTAIEQFGSHKYVVEKAMLMNMRGENRQALQLLAREYHSLPDSMVQEKQDISYSYEEIAVPYIKSLVASGMTHTAWRQVEEALEICPQSNDILHYAISLSLARHEDKQAKEYAQQGIETFPNDPYFRLKNAQMMIKDKDYSSSIDSLRALIDVYPGDTTIILAFTDCSENLALQYMKKKENDKAMAVLDTALYFNLDSHSLLYTKAMLYAKMKNWSEAEKLLKTYKPDFREYRAYKRSLEEIGNHQMLNAMSWEYQRARLGSEDAITANAYLSYTRKLPWRTRMGRQRMDALTFGAAYAGRDGKADDDTASDQTKGGTGIQLTAAWEHQFTNRFTTRLEGGWSNRYFPTWVANIGFTYDMRNEWQLTGRANFRWLKTYQGIWEMSHIFAGYDQKGEPLYANEMRQTGWIVKNKPMEQVGIGLGKTFGPEERFNVSAGVDAFHLSGNFYFNGNAKVMFYPMQDRKTHIFAQAGLGTAPESSLIDQSLAVGFSDLNTFTSMGGQYMVNRHLSLGLTGSWYTMLTQKETLTLPLHGKTAQTTKNYANYFYIHASLLLSF